MQGHQSGGWSPTTYMEYPQLYIANIHGISSLNITHRIHVCYIYMVTFAMNIPQMLAYIPYMDTMGYDICFFCHSRFSSRLTSAGPTLLFEGSKDYGKAKWGEQRISPRKGETKRRQSVQDSIKQEFMYMYRSTKEYWQIDIWQCFRPWRITHRRFTQSSFTWLND